VLIQDINQHAIGRNAGLVASNAITVFASRKRRQQLYTWKWKESARNYLNCPDRPQKNTKDQQNNAYQPHTCRELQLASIWTGYGTASLIYNAVSLSYHVVLNVKKTGE
jgi:hypothetical protein